MADDAGPVAADVLDRLEMCDRRLDVGGDLAVDDVLADNRAVGDPGLAVEQLGRRADIAHRRHPVGHVLGELVEPGAVAHDDDRRVRTLAFRHRDVDFHRTSADIDRVVARHGALPSNRE